METCQNNADGVTPRNKIILIPNWLETYALEVDSRPGRDSIGPLVTIHQKAGGMAFQFDMTADQARALAAALIEHADLIDETGGAA